MKAEKFDQQFEGGVDITASLDLSKARRVLQSVCKHSNYKAFNQERKRKMKVRKLIPSILLALTAATQVYAAPYYTNKAGDMVWDKETQLVWARCQLGQQWDGNTCAGKASEYKFDDTPNAAKKFNAEGGLGGHTDWVMPTIRQLLSLRICSKGFSKVTEDLKDGKPEVPSFCTGDDYIKPTIDSIAFPNTPASRVWSGSPNAYNSSGAWFVNFNDGNSYGSYSRGFNDGVRLVRGGQFSGSKAALAFPVKLEESSEWKAHAIAKRKAEQAEQERRAAEAAQQRAAAEEERCMKTPSCRAKKEREKPSSSSSNYSARIGQSILVCKTDGEHCRAVMLTPGEDKSEVQFEERCTYALFTSASRGEKMWVPNGAISPKDGSRCSN